MIICKYLLLSHRLHYERSGLNTDQVVSLFRLYKIGFRFDAAKKIVCEIAMIEQIKWREETIQYTWDS